MHLNHATFRAAPCRPACCVLIASGCALLPTSHAYGITMEELISVASSQPLVTFGVGCATGAVVGGLVAALIGRGRRRALERRIVDLEVMVQQQSYPDILSGPETESTLDLAENHKATPQSKKAAQATPTQQEQQKQQVQPAKPAQATPVHEQPQAQQSKAQQSKAQQPEEAAQKAPEPKRATKAAESHKSEHNVRELLFSRLGSAAFGDVPVIARGAQREDDLESTAKRVAMRQMDSAERAQAIDKRIPRFDESLFPENPVAEVEAQKTDEFEQAMHAMENSMPLELVQQSNPNFESAKPENQPEINDAAAYVDYLLNDEMELGRSHQAHRFSRPKLTVFEGTGDLNRARKRTYSARHFSNVSKEA